MTICIGLAFLFMLFGVEVQAQDQVVVISPHRKSIQREFIPRFEAYYFAQFNKKISVEWIDQGGTENDLNFIYNRYKQNSKTSDIDIFWGGGDMTFLELENKNLLESYRLPSQLENQIPSSAIGISFKSKQYKWYASALSSFGIFYNKRLLQLVQLPTPKTWSDLGKPIYNDYLSIADPNHSTSSLVMDLIILEALGWDKGWQLLTALAGNCRKFSHSSSDPIKSVVSGDAAVATAIDFYANAKVLSLGEKNLGFVFPKGQTIYNTDPIAILKGAPNRKQAEIFVNFILSKEMQKVLFLPKGISGGPVFSSLGRIAVNQHAYIETKSLGINILNPFNQGPSHLTFNFKRFTMIKTLIRDIIAAVHVAPHRALKKAWNFLTEHQLDKSVLNRFLQLPLTEKQALEYVKNWENQSFRNNIMNQLTKNAQKKYEMILQLKSS